MRSFLPVATALLLLAACGADSAPHGSRKGGEGASCLTTNDCKLPFECFDNVCVGPASDADAVSSDALADAVDSPDEGGALDLGPMPDLGPPPSQDAVVEVLGDLLGEVEEPKDLPPGPDLPDGQLNPIGDCEELGIASAWEGTWSGSVSYDIPFSIPGADQQGTLPVAGDMTFEIQCIDQKLVVLGDMIGMALDEYPFTLELQGGYNPETGVLKAAMVNGSVKLFNLVDVLFEGTLEGELITPQLMNGTWVGESVGTNPPGIPGTAWGDGEWTATPQP